jgi:autotransporter-associated beta strand protein
LAKNGTGTLAITADNTFSSGVTINGGVLSFTGETAATAGSANPLGALPATATPGYISLSTGTTLRSTKVGAAAGTGSYVSANRGIAISGGVNLDMVDGTADTALLCSAIITGSGGFTKIGAGTILLGGLNTYSGDTTILQGGLGVNATARLGDGLGTLVLAGGMLLSSANQTFANALPNPILMQTNITIRAYNNSYTSGLRQFRLASPNIVATNGTFTLENHGTAGATLFAVQFTTMGGLQFTRPIVLGAGCRFDLWNDDTVNNAIFSGTISGPGFMQYTSSGTGTGGSTVVTGTNTYSGTNSLNGGYLGFGLDTFPASGTITSGPIGTSTLYVKNDPTVGIFAYGGPRIVRNPMNFVTVDVFRIIGTNNLTMQGTLALNTSNLTFMVDNTGLTTFSGVISGGSAGKGLTKNGTGTLIFGAANTYVITNVISSGTLLVTNATGSGTGTGSVTVNSGATLGGTGRITGAVSCSGNISPGMSAGTLTLAGGLNLSSGTYIWELATNSTAAGSFDQIAVTGGTLVLGGSSILSLGFTNAATTPSFSNSFWQANHSWTIVAVNGGTNTGSSNFATVQNATYEAGSFSTSVDGSGNIVLNYVSNAPQVQNFGLLGGNFSLNWSTISGRSYAVEYKTNLNSGFIASFCCLNEKLPGRPRKKKKTLTVASQGSHDLHGFFYSALISIWLFTEFTPEMDLALDSASNRSASVFTVPFRVTMPSCTVNFTLL